MASPKVQGYLSSLKKIQKYQQKAIHNNYHYNSIGVHQWEKEKPVVAIGVAVLAGNNIQSSAEWWRWPGCWWGFEFEKISECAPSICVFHFIFRKQYKCTQSLANGSVLPCLGSLQWCLQFPFTWMYYPRSEISNLVCNSDSYESYCSK